MISALLVRKSTASTRRAIAAWRPWICAGGLWCCAQDRHREGRWEKIGPLLAICVY